MKPVADLRRGLFPEQGEFGVVVTFDDGFRDNYLTGLEVLDTLGIKGVFFQCSAMIDGDQLIPEHALYWLCYELHDVEELLQAARGANWTGAEEVGTEPSQATVQRWLREVPSGSMLALLGIGVALRSDVVGLASLMARPPVRLAWRGSGSTQAYRSSVTLVSSM